MATAITAALIAVVSILIARGVLDIAVLAPEGEGAWGDADTGRYAIFAAAAAILATALIHVLILFVPRYNMFFGWIITLATVAGVVAPFAVDAERSAQVATALINFILGVTIGSLLAGVARVAIRTAAAEGVRDEGPYPPEGYPPESYPPDPYQPR